MTTQIRAPSSTATRMAMAVCRDFQHHDRRDREAAEALVDALWAKDRVEAAHTADGDLDQRRLRFADWTPVYDAFQRRAAAVDVESPYASERTTAWRRHKVGGDYWTPFLRSQVREIAAALGDPSYPQKPHQGQSGYSPEALRFLLGVELHDMHTADHWRQAAEAMALYYEFLLREGATPDRSPADAR